MKSTLLSLSLSFITVFSLLAQNNETLDLPKPSLDYETQVGGTWSLADVDPGTGSDLSPQGSTPELSLSTDIFQKNTLKKGLDTGFFTQFKAKGAGTWVPLAVTYMGVLDSTSLEGSLGWRWKAGKKSGNWKMDLGFQGLSTHNESSSDLPTPGTVTNLDYFSYGALGAGMEFSQTLESGIFGLKYNPEVNFFKVLDSNITGPGFDTSLKGALKLDLGVQALEISGGLTLKKIIQPEFSTQGQIQGTWKGDFLKFGFIPLSWDFSVFIPDFDGKRSVGQKLTYSTGAQLEMRGDDWTLEFSLSQAWWSLYRARINESQDKDLTFRITWKTQGSDELKGE
ncbi:MAG: hypothetical protein A2Z96_03195 [Spirochaetes bacterium GWB1_48_6]|nr:MAG: hypothetical protein A2Z96_03195 [Spirochaetes bacterium GWB1_48_6]